MARFRIKCIIISYVIRNSLECINMVQVVPETANLFQWHQEMRIKRDKGREGRRALIDMNCKTG